MYLSRIALDAGRGETMRLLASPNLLHGAVEHCFDGKKRRNLWRIDTLGGEPYLLILSEAVPAVEDLVSRYGRDDLPCPRETKSYDALLNRLAEGQPWHFRLRANPVRSSTREREGKRSRGKLFNHVTQDQQKNWLAARGSANGFFVEDNSFDVVHAQWHKFRKGNGGTGEVSILTVTFEGRLTITNLALFRSALVNGIGREKAYGCGLMTIVRDGGQ